jgi:manganese efflux pump family protein
MYMIWQLVLLGMALALNNTLAAVAIGTNGLPRLHQLRLALVFAIFEAVMPVVGILLGHVIAGSVGGYAKWIGIAVLALLGLYSLFKREKRDEASSPTSRRDQPTAQTGLSLQSIVMAVALSLDNLTVGFGLGMFQVPIGVSAIIFGVVSLVMTLLGLEIGRALGARVRLDADKLAGGILLVVAGVMAFA